MGRRLDDSQGSTATPASLIAGLRRGDSRSWTEMVDLYAPLVRHWCRRCSLSPADAADVMQEVFLTVARHIRRFGYRRAGDSFRGWLWTVTRSRVQDHHRRRGRRVEAPGGSTAMARLSELADENALPDEEPTAAVEISALLRRGLDQVRAEFEPRTWDAFWRSSVDGLSTESVAEQLGVTPAAVRQARSRVLRRLRRQLGDQPSD